MDESVMDSTAQELMVEGKGILAIDESLPTIGKRFASIGVESHRGQSQGVARAVDRHTGLRAIPQRGHPV